MCKSIFDSLKDVLILYLNCYSYRNCNQVASLLVDVFAEMIFCHGYVHGDPHPGNLLVHRDPSRSGKHNFDIGWWSNMLLDRLQYNSYC